MTAVEYEITETVFESDKSIIYRAVRPSDSRSFIAKTTSKEYPSYEDLARLKLEFNILNQLRLPGVIETHGFEEIAGRPAILMEAFDGADLAVYKPNPIPLGLFFEIALPLVKTLGEIHHRQIIHKDINPRNILVNPRTNQVKLIDFNIASELTREERRLDTATLLEGSLDYISPEQTGRINRDVDHRSDYYSLGITFYEILTGRLPFVAADAVGIVHCHLSMRPEDPRGLNPEIPGSLARIVLKLMEKNAEDRYQSARGLQRDLERCRDAFETGEGDDFALGADDVSRIFRIPDKLYGREAELRLLSDAVEAISAGRSCFLLVSGYAGIGKSSLMNEVRAIVMDRGGYFISGKFDQLERNVPFFAIVQAIRGLIAKILAEPKERLAAWRRTLNNALGQSGRLMVDIIPELQKVIGPQPPLPKLSSEETKHLLRHIFTRFVTACVDPTHPMVLFLDDLQWGDAASIDLCLSFVEADIPHLMLVGAYRDNELNEQLPLQDALAKLGETESGVGRERVQHLRLKPLNAAAVNHLVADTLHVDPETCAPLSEIVFNKTQGNPYFTNELLQALYRKGGIVFDGPEGRWTWDLDVIHQQSMSDNVVDLIVDRLASFPKSTREALELAACIGHKFELKTLASVSGRPMAGLANDLLEPVRMGMILPLSRNYRLLDVGSEEALTDLNVVYMFLHDRIQQAAYASIPLNKRAEIHYRIGAVLRSGLDEVGREISLFDIVNQLNLGKERMGDDSERLALVRLNLRAGEKAKGASAYTVAASYFNAGIAALTDEVSGDHSGLRFMLMKGLVESVFVSGETERALSLCGTLGALAESKLQVGAVTIQKAVILEHQGKLVETVETLREGLRYFDVVLPTDPAVIDREIGESIGWMQAYLAEHSVSKLAKLPEMQDEERRIAAEMLYYIIPSAIQTYPPLFVLVELTMLKMAVAHGTCAFSSKNFVDCGIIQGGILGNYQTAYEFGQVAFEILDKYHADNLRCGVGLVFATFVSHWRAHFQESLAAFDRAFAAGLETGAISHAAYCAGFRSLRLLYVGKTLKECETDVESTIAYTKRCGAIGQLETAEITHWAILRLAGNPEVEDADIDWIDQAFFERIEQSENAANLCILDIFKAMLDYLHGDFESTLEAITASAPRIMSIAGRFPLADRCLFHGLTLMETLDGMTTEARGAAVETARGLLKELKTYADNCPANFAHKHDLLAAEIARVDGAPLEAVLALYESAVSAIGPGEFLHMKAMIRERQSRYWMERGDPLVARAYLLEAHTLFSQWGARTKVALLEKAYPAWFDAPRRADSRQESQRGTLEVAGMDSASILKAALAISGTIELEKLLMNLTTTLMENAGAEKGSLILKYDTTDRLLIEAVGEAGEEVRVLQSQPVDESDEVCPEIVRYVARSRKPLVLGNAWEEGEFRASAYIAARRVKSILCMPLVTRDALKAIVYLENNLTPYAFTPKRVSVLKAIAGPAAVTMENAFMYSHLDELVKKRTAELEAAQAELTEIAHKAGMAEVAASVLHNVGNILNSLHTAGRMVHESAQRSKLKGLAKANALLKTNLHDLETFVLENPKGKKLLEYYLELGDALELERTELLDNSRQILSCTEAIAGIINAQQKYAYIDSSFSEVLELDEIVENALTLNAASYARHRIRVEKRFARVPRVSLHRSKTLHTVLNLLKNAKEAMVEHAEEARVVVIDLYTEDRFVVLKVADTGEGIEADNLTKIFNFGFTTKPGGHGSGLHSSANYLIEMGGRIWAESDGPGKGATFYLMFPHQRIDPRSLGNRGVPRPGSSEKEPE